MDRQWRRVTRLSKLYWQAAKGALSLPGADTAFGAVLDDASTSAHEGGGIGILPVDNEVEVAEVGHDPASLSIGAGVVIPEGVWEWLKLVAGDDGTRVSPSRSEGLEVKSWAKDLRGERGEDSEVMPSLSCILRLLMCIGRRSA